MMIRFGKACDGAGCAVRFNDYDVGTIRACRACHQDLCPVCAIKTGHVAGRDADIDGDAQWKGCPADDEA